MKPLAVIIYHNKDLDGFCSGAIAFAALEYRYNIEMVGYNYGDPVPDIIGMDAEIVVMVDITFPLHDVLHLAKHFGSRFTLIDHHVSFFDIYMEHWQNTESPYIYDQDKAACELAWGHFFPNKEIPDIVDCVAVWDIHRKDTRMYKAFLDFDSYATIQKGLRMELEDPQDPDALEWWCRLLEEEAPEFMHECMQAGITLDKHSDNVAKLMDKNAHEIEISGVSFYAFNSAGANKGVTVPDGYALCFYFYDGEKWVYSLRQNERYETRLPILEVAKANGGGGHLNACGFSMNVPPSEFKG